MTPSYYRGAQGVILVYDVTSRTSFNKLEMWMSELDTYSTKSDMVKMLVGNKIDKVSKSQSRKKNSGVCNFKLIEKTCLQAECAICQLI